MSARPVISATFAKSEKSPPTLTSSDVNVEDTIGPSVSILQRSTPQPPADSRTHASTLDNSPVSSNQPVGNLSGAKHGRGDVRRAGARSGHASDTSVTSSDSSSEGATARAKAKHALTSKRNRLRKASASRKVSLFDQKLLRSQIHRSKCMHDLPRNALPVRSFSTTVIYLQQVRTRTGRVRRRVSTNADDSDSSASSGSSNVRTPTYSNKFGAFVV
jgi:hypothetical protein